MARVPKASPVACATRLYSLTPTPMIAASRVLNRLSIRSQISAVNSGTRTRSAGSALRIDGAVASSEKTEARMQAHRTTAVSLTRRIVR